MSKLRLLIRLIVIGLMLILIACDSYAPINIGPISLQYGELAFPAEKSQPICHALENAGYIMPYGSPFGWFKFNAMQPAYGIRPPNLPFIEMPYGNPYLYILVDWSIPTDYDASERVSQETVDSLKTEAENICHIVQTEAKKQGIPNLTFHISMRDLIGGSVIEYGGYQGDMISNCDQIRGFFNGSGMGLNPQGRTPNMCPSLYVPG